MSAQVVAYCKTKHSSALSALCPADWPSWGSLGVGQ